MLQTSARLLRLLSLFQARRYWSGAELAERLEITARTLRRDVDRLRSLGYPVHSTTGTAGGYQLSAGASLPPLLLDDEEAVAVAVGLRTAASGTVSGMEEASVRALLKLEQVLPSRLRRRVAALNSFIVSITHATPSVDAGMLSIIAGACRDNDGLRFAYRSHDGVFTTRDVEPHRLVYTGHRWYLVAWDKSRKDWRTFRVDRIDAKLSTGSRFTSRKPPDKDLAAYVSRSVSYAPYAHRARVVLHAPLEKIATMIPPTAGRLLAIDKKTCSLETGANSLTVLSAHLALIGVDFEVREPPELVEHIRSLAERLRRATSAAAEPIKPL
jgi:predicted DNA-binding transcriptional regulator YafY